ncbi:hypothetical protein G5714_024612 [Onychostoma macrolepis]|uniref:Uncharacterized protein n=1 Tax=Onychostoma macrolepis TaxID=369639 RepID=A0A7J6BHA3_9TELE|nr:hypothetical protein G5714_024612 [Onychostoma macrolepis]
MATRSLRVRRLISPQWGQSDPPSAASAWARPRQKTHDSWPSEGSIGSTQERQSREVIFIRPKLTGTQQGKKRRVRCRVGTHDWYLAEVVQLQLESERDSFSATGTGVHITLRTCSVPPSNPLSPR